MDSSWIESVSRNDNTGVVTMTTESGNAYEILGMSDSQTEDWNNDASGGSYFNQNVKGKHDIVRTSNG
jgi:hypothetical protein